MDTMKGDTFTFLCYITNTKGFANGHVQLFLSLYYKLNSNFCLKSHLNQTKRPEGTVFISILIFQVFTSKSPNKIQNARLYKIQIDHKTVVLIIQVILMCVGT